MLRAFDRFASSAAGFELVQARTDNDWDEVSGLRYRAFLAHGDVAEDVSQRFLDHFDRVGGAATFLLRRGGQAIASARAAISRQEPCPFLLCDTVYQEDLDRLVHRRPSYVEMGLAAVNGVTYEDSRLALLCLFKAAAMFGIAHGAAWLFSAVRENDIGFHGRVLGMQILSGPERVPTLATPRVLMGFELESKLDELARRVPMFLFEPSEIEQYRPPGLGRT